MTDAPATLSELQRRLEVALEGLRHPPLGSVAALAEEVGELSKLLVDHHCYGKAFDAEAFGDELADVFICLCELATLHAVDLEAATLRKTEKVATKAAGWRADLGGALQRAWTRPYGDAVKPPKPASPG
ncbi:MAG TPA: hypothetical protein VEI02_02600 [Planctomycetota bacterium]|nr:hypothetical protein [Planctomycetota bacterium]